MVNLHKLKCALVQSCQNHCGSLLLCCAVPEFVFMFDNPVYHWVPSDEVCWCAGSTCKSIGEARDNGCTDNIKRFDMGKRRRSQGYQAYF